MASNPLRIPDEIWRLVRIAAGASGQSANAWIVAAVREKLLRLAHADKAGPVAAALNNQRAGR